MQKIIFLTIFVLLHACTLGLTQQISHDIILWQKNAQDPNENINVRLTAIDQLGNIRLNPNNLNDRDNFMYLKQIFKDLLTHPAGAEFKHNVLFSHVAKALAKGNLGGDVHDLLPLLSAKKGGGDRLLDEDIRQAEIAVGRIPRNPPQNPQAPAPNPQQRHINAMLAVLSDGGSKVDMRISAALDLLSLGKANLAGQNRAVIDALTGIINTANVDENLKCVAEKVKAKLE